VAGRSSGASAHPAEFSHGLLAQEIQCSIPRQSDGVGDGCRSGVRLRWGILRLTAADQRLVNESSSLVKDWDD